jgi:hypothetical protein
MSRRQVLRLLSGPVLTACLAACELLAPVTGEVPVGEGATPDGRRWQAVLVGEATGATCLVIRVQGEQTLDRGCGWKAPGDRLLADPDGFVIASVRDPRVTSGRMRFMQDAVIEVDAVPGLPLSSASFIVISPPIRPELVESLAFDLELLDERGQVIDTLAR